MPTADGGGKRTMKNRMEKLMEKQHITLATAAQMMQCYSIYLLQQKNTKTAIYINNRNTNGCAYYKLTSIDQLGKKTTGN